MGVLLPLLAGCGESFTYLAPPSVEGEPGVLLAVEGEGGAGFHGSAGWPSAPALFSRELAGRVQVALLPGPAERFGLPIGEFEVPVPGLGGGTRRLSSIPGVSFLEARFEDDAWIARPEPAGALATLELPDRRSCRSLELEGEYTVSPGLRHAGLIPGGRFVAITSPGELVELRLTGTATIGDNFTTAGHVKRHFVALPKEDRVWVQRIGEVNIGRVRHGEHLFFAHRSRRLFADLLDIDGGETADGAQNVCVLEIWDPESEGRRVHCWSPGAWRQVAELGPVLHTRIDWAGGDRFLLGGGVGTQWLEAEQVRPAFAPEPWSFARWLPELGMALGTPDGRFFLERDGEFRLHTQLDGELRDAALVDGALFVLLMDGRLVELADPSDPCPPRFMGPAAGDSWLLWNGERLAVISVATLQRSSAQVSFLRRGPSAD